MTTILWPRALRLIAMDPPAKPGRRASMFVTWPCAFVLTVRFVTGLWISVRPPTSDFDCSPEWSWYVGGLLLSIGLGATLGGVPMGARALPPAGCGGLIGFCGAGRFTFG